MKLKHLIVKGYKNLTDFEIDFQNRDGVTLLIGNNGSGKSNLIEAISSIFLGLYKHSSRDRKPDFEYKIEYVLRNKEISIALNSRNTYSFKVDGNTILKRDFINGLDDYLPSQVIACYSGEDDRLWSYFFQYPYFDWINAIKGGGLQSVPSQKLQFINKYYWNIALLSYLFIKDEPGFDSIKEFIEEDLGITQVDKIVFQFNDNNLRKFQGNQIVHFVNNLKQIADEDGSMTLEQLKTVNVASERQLFSFLAASYMPKDDKLISKITIHFNTNLVSELLSEGEKKLLLVKAVEEIVADENSLVLFDEPDSHIHISRKERMKRIFFDNDGQPFRDNVITTHSPTLTHSFDIKHIVALNRENDGVKVIPEDKKLLIDRLTGGIWSYEEQNIFLNSSKHILLFEGKWDTYYLKRAIDILRVQDPKYDIDVIMVHCGGADNVVPFFNELIKTTMKPTQMCISVFDDDGKGRINYNKITEIIQNENLNNVKCFKYPKTPVAIASNAQDFILEDYFPIVAYKTEMETLLQNASSYTQLNGLRDAKKLIQEKYESFDNAHYSNFKIVLDKIIDELAAFQQ